MGQRSELESTCQFCEGPLDDSYLCAACEALHGADEYGRMLEEWVNSLNWGGFEEISEWSQVKHEILEKYAAAYTTILSKQSFLRRLVYIDAFAGTGFAQDKATREFVPGSAMRAIRVAPPFQEVHLIERAPTRVTALRASVPAGDAGRVTIHEGDFLVHLPAILERCRYEDYARALCLLDPYGLSVPWTLLEQLGSMGSVEIFFNFMVVGANRNVLWHNPDRVPEQKKASMDRVWGDRKAWQEACYAVSPPDLFEQTRTVKQTNEAIAERFRLRLQQKAGFQYVPSPIPVKNRRGATLYYLFFASPNRTGARIVEDIFAKHR